MSRQLSKAKVESTRQPTLVLAKSTPKQIVSSFLRSSQQKPGYKFGSTSASKRTSFFDNESEKDYYRVTRERRIESESKTIETVQIISDGDDNETTRQLKTSTYLNIGEGLFNGLNESRSQMNESLKDLTSMSVGEQVCRKQLMQSHLPVIEAMKLLDLNEEPKFVKQSMDQLFQQNIVCSPNEIQVWSTMLSRSLSSLVRQTPRLNLAVRGYAAAAQKAADTSEDLRLILASPLKSYYANTVVKQVDVPTLAGTVGVLAKHVPTIGVLKPGVVDVTDSEGKHIKLFVSSGTFSMNIDGTCQVLAEEIIDVGEIDESLARQELDAAQRSSGTGSEVERAEAQIRAEVAEALLKAATGQQ